MKKKEWPSYGKEDQVQVVPRHEDGMYFFEVYISGIPDAGNVTSSEGEADRLAQDLAEKHGRKINYWKGWW